MKLFQIAVKTAIIPLLAASVSVGTSFNNQTLPAQSSIIIAQVTKTHKIVIKDLGYSFDVPNGMRVIRDGNFLEVLTQKNYEQRQRGQKNCTYQDSTVAGCSDFSINIEGNGRKKLVQAHKELITPCRQCGAGTGLDVFKGEITVNARTYRKYELADEHQAYNIYLYLTNKNHLVTVVLDKAPYAGNRDALVTAMGSFK
ncbi:hypothetical protein [Nostoc sp. LPT]|uniref:hypothetical protein n=1 Tax=Nostoc sp. LPT TaxID=2815387 RepID=UPI001D8C0C4C|nr:hypothetical protein [Nostoc sp. LPT]MBN4002393.1 hypothetical protein [Nostoc sp. LPT]